MPGEMVQLALAGALARMNDFHRHLDQMPAVELQPETEIHIFAIHEVALVEPLQFSPEGRGHQQASRVDPVHTHL